MVSIQPIFFGKSFFSRIRASTYSKVNPLTVPGRCVKCGMIPWAYIAHAALATHADSPTYLPTHIKFNAYPTLSTYPLARFQPILARCQYIARPYTP